MKPLQRNMTAVALAFGLMCTGPAGADEPNPYRKSDESWISIGGEVVSVSPDTFLLDYGDGIITVEMDDGDRDADAYKLLKGDKVTVNGRIDDDFFETTSIEASSVYVEKLGTYLYASPNDEEDYSVWYTVPVIAGETVVQGMVSEVGGDEFVVNTGLRSVTVDVDEMAYDPLDEEGYQRIETGDIVRVMGRMEDDLFEERELKASYIITLVD